MIGSLLLAMALPASNPSAVRGEAIYRNVCQACHLPSGQGIPGVFPPLAGSDFLRDRTRVIRVLCEGLEGPIVVNGQRYNGVMPLFPLSDREVADVLTFVQGSWGNTGEPYREEDVTRVRASLKLATLDAALQAAAYPPLPAAPEGFDIREVVRLPDYPSRMIAAPGGGLLVLGTRGAVWRVDVEAGTIAPYLDPTYLDPAYPEVSTTGMGLDPKGRLYITVNQLDRTTRPATNRVSIVRTPPLPAQGPAPAPEVWLKTAYPYGVGPFNHAVNAIAAGPDGKLYVNSGSRTDANETGRDPAFYTGGETRYTACIWRLEPGAEEPLIEIFARGFRNTYGFCWDDRGRMLGVENGPDAHAPEELNVIEEHGHYGFPYEFANGMTNLYAHTPTAPAGVVFTRPVLNTGPDGGKGLHTFEPHSCPTSIVWLDDSFPEGWRGHALVARFGNMIRLEQDTGFDLLKLNILPAEAVTYAACERVLTGLARPLDVVAGRGRIYLLEYSRHTALASKTPQMPGRILELRARGP